MEDKISGLEEKSDEDKEKRMKYKQNIQELWDSDKRPNL
jgi:hypothetical protein